MARATIETGGVLTVFSVRWFFDGWWNICDRLRLATAMEAMAAHVLSDGVPDRGGVLLSALRSDCNDEPLVGLSAKCIIQYDSD